MNTHSSAPLRILVAGGGTGGHVFPALAIRQAIAAREPSARVMFVGTKSGIEARIIPTLNEPFRSIWISGISRSRPLKNLILPVKLVVSSVQCLRLLLTFRPNVVVGTGGYVMGPVLWLAQRLGIPTVLQEQNSYPGLTTKKLARHANAVCVGFESARKRIPSTNVIHTGNPLRLSFQTIERETAREKWPLDGARRTVLVLGGSAGARSINEVIGKSLSKLLSKYNLIWQTGRTGVPAEVSREYLQTMIDSRHLIIRDFIEDMPEAYAVSDLAVCRAGAMTLAELAMVAVPAVLIPYPFATDDHQTENAASVVAAGAGQLIADRDLSTDTLWGAVTACLDSEDTHKRAKTAMRSLSNPNAARDIADIVINAAGRGD